MLILNEQVILALTNGQDSSRPQIQVLARLSEHHSSNGLHDLGDDQSPRGIVAARQGKHLITTFHPELTKDSRFHEYFVKHCVLG